LGAAALGAGKAYMLFRGAREGRKAAPWVALFAVACAVVVVAKQ